jgi:hypothetical protein
VRVLCLVVVMVGASRHFFEVTSENIALSLGTDNIFLDTMEDGSFGLVEHDGRCIPEPRWRSAYIRQSGFPSLGAILRV